MKYEYKRICSSCGDIAIVGYKPKGDEECYKCSRAKLGANLSKHKYKDHAYIRYIYLCRHCPKVLIKECKVRSGLCGDCNRKYSKKKLPKYNFDFDSMQTICIWKPETKIKVVKQLKPKVEKIKIKVVKQLKPKVEKIKIVCKIKEPVVKEDEVKNKMMVNEWLKNNKVKVL